MDLKLISLFLLSCILAVHFCNGAPVLNGNHIISQEPEEDAESLFLANELDEGEFGRVKRDTPDWLKDIDDDILQPLKHRAIKKVTGKLVEKLTDKLDDWFD